jgi:transmembrane sensor
MDRKMERIEKNYDKLKLALQQLPTYAMPDKNWDIVEHTLDIDVRHLPNTTIPIDIWHKIEATLNQQKFSLPELQIPVDIWDDIGNKLDASDEKIIGVNTNTIVHESHKKTFQRTWQLMAAVASIVLLFCIGKWMLSPTENIEMMAFDGTALQSMQFEDGSVVYSKQNAKINYPKNFAKNTREVIQTDGVAFYEITKNANRPFIIHSEIGTITVLGTSFTTNVSADSIQVIVKTGKVSVTTETDSVLLLPTESVVYYADGRKPKLMDGAMQLVINNGIGNTTGQKIISYDATTIISILEEVKIKYKVQISYNANALANKKITGKFVDGDAGALITAICEASGLTVIKNNQAYIIQ